VSLIGLPGESRDYSGMDNGFRRYDKEEIRRRPNQRRTSAASTPPNETAPDSEARGQPKFAGKRIACVAGGLTGKGSGVNVKI
jgi:hypothetical protein